jgi:hypothetical protein
MVSAFIIWVISIVNDVLVHILGLLQAKFVLLSCKTVWNEKSGK